MLYHHVCLESLAYELPPFVVSTESIFDRITPTLERLKIPVESVVGASGVEEIRFWPEELTITETATRAARKALTASRIDPQDIGLLISTSVCKDYIEPSMAALVHGELGLAEHCKNFDVGSACLGFFAGVSLAADYIDSGKVQSALVVASESSRKVVESTIERLLSEETTVSDFQLNFATLTLGSGAVAAVLTHDSLSQAKHRIRGHVTLSSTKDRHLCLGNPTQMLVQARPLLEAGLELYQRTWKRSKEVFQWDVNDIDLFVCHQVGARHYSALFDVIGADIKNTFASYPFLGNVGPSLGPFDHGLSDRGWSA